MERNGSGERKKRVPAGRRQISTEREKGRDKGMGLG
jgi:hypothetical protein